MITFDYPYECHWDYHVWLSLWLSTWLSLFKLSWNWYKPYHRESCCSNLLCQVSHHPANEKPDEKFSQRDLLEIFSDFDYSLPQHLPLHSCFRMVPVVQLLIWTLVGYQQWLFWFHSPFPDYPWTLLQSEDLENQGASKKEKDEGGDCESDDEDVEVGHADIKQGDDVARWRNVWILMQVASVPVPAGRAEAFRSTFHNPENCTQSSIV